MPSEIVERVARAIFDQHLLRGDFDGVFDELEEVVKNWFYDDANAAIMVMRCPTFEMIFAGTDQHLHRSTFEGQAGASWRAMIDVALKCPFAVISVSNISSSDPVMES